MIEYLIKLYFAAIVLKNPQDYIDGVHYAVQIIAIGLGGVLTALAVVVGLIYIQSAFRHAKRARVLWNTKHNSFEVDVRVVHIGTQLLGIPVDRSHTQKDFRVIVDFVRPIKPELLTLLEEADENYSCGDANKTHGCYDLMAPFEIKNNLVEERGHKYTGSIGTLTINTDNIKGSKPTITGFSADKGNVRYF